MTILSSWHNRLFSSSGHLLSVSTDLTPDFPDCAATTLRVGLLSFFANESDQKREQMAVYRDDPDLQFLGQCDNEALDLLVRLITHDPGIALCAGQKHCLVATTTGVSILLTATTGRRSRLKSRPLGPAALSAYSEGKKACCTGRC
jgi:hypothetical protein